MGLGEALTTHLIRAFELIGGFWVCGASTHVISSEKQEIIREIYLIHDHNKTQINSPNTSTVSKRKEGMGFYVAFNSLKSNLDKIETEYQEEIQFYS